MIRIHLSAMTSKAATKIVAVLMFALLNACGPIQASRVEAMNSDERLALLQKDFTGDLCRKYLHPFVQDKTKAQIAEILHHRGVNDCVVTGGSTVPVEAAAGLTIDPGPYAHPTITVEELRRNAEQVRAYEAKDQLDFGPNLSSLVGKTFLIDIATRPRGPNNEICPGTPSWGYSVERSNLEISYGSLVFLRDYHKNDQQVHSGGLSSNFSGYALDCRVSWGKPHLGVNAFGTTVTVNVRNEKFLTIITEQSLRGISADVWQDHASPDQARNLTSAARIRVQGRIAEWTAGRPIVCGVRTERPQFPEAIEEKHDGCFVKAVIDRIDLIDTRSNTVLRSRQPSKGWGASQASTSTH